MPKEDDTMTDKNERLCGQMKVPGTWFRSKIKLLTASERDPYLARRISVRVATEEKGLCSFIAQRHSAVSKGETRSQVRVSRNSSTLYTILCVNNT